LAAEYDPLAGVYEWLVPDQLVEPAGAAAAFEGVIAALPAGGRVLDCAAGAGQLAVGLALRGLDVTATDISPAMVQRVRELAGRHGVDLRAEVSAWETLGQLRFRPFDAVLCVGNSIPHAEARSGRRAALSAMRAQLRRGGLLAVTSRNWDLVRSGGSHLEFGDRLVVRGGVPAVIAYSWTIPRSWDEPHGVEVGVALLDDESVSAHVGRLTVWPFEHATLVEDLASSGFGLTRSTYSPDAERYLVTAAAT
jgi:SAM-dependent methyltransferase